MCELTKKCNACLKIKDLFEFSKDKARPHGVSDKCRKCHSEKKLSARHVEPLGKFKICEICLVEKDLSAFYKRPDRSYTHEPRCIQCTKEGKLIDKKIFINDKKKCSICEIYKNFSEYIECKNCLNGISAQCKDCYKITNKKYRDSIPNDVKKERKRQEYLRNREGYLRRSKQYAENNREHLTEWRRKYEKNIKNTNSLLHLTRNIRSLIKTTFVRGLIEDIKKAKKTCDILGCSFEKFKEHIESQFENWMSWENYGNVCEQIEYNCSWDLDHIIPISSAKTEEEVYMLNHWSNFQPLCSYKNRNVKKNIVHPLTNLELNITVIENKQIIYND